MLSIKVAIFVAMMAIGIAITRIGLKLAKQPSQEYIIKAQKRLKILSKANIFLGLVVILLSVALRVGV